MLAMRRYAKRSSCCSKARASLRGAGDQRGFDLHRAQPVAVADLDLHHVPFKGVAPALVDLTAGREDIMFTSCGSVRSFIRPIG